MANQITDNRTLVDSAEATTNYVDLAGVAAGTADNEVFIQGSNSIGEYVSNSLVGCMYNAGSAQDWSNNTFYVWINCAVTGVLDTKANGGFRIRFTGATVTDWFEVYVAGGGDEWPVAIAGGWVQFVVDIEEARSQAVTNGWTNGTTPATTAIQRVGWAGICTSMPRMLDNVWIDEIRRLPDGSPGIIVEGRNGGTTDWNSADIFTELGLGVGTFLPSAGGAWKINAPIQFGINDTTTHGFDDTNAIWLWDDQEFLVDGFYSISALGNSGGTTNVTMGVKTGTGDDATGAQGLTIAAATTGVRWDMDFDDPNLDAISLNGCSLQHGGTFQLDDPAVEVISSLYIDCTQAQVQDSLQLRNSVINANTADGAAFMVTDNMLDIRFCSFEFSDGHAIELTASVVDPQENRGNLFSGYTNTNDSTDAAIYLSEAGNPDLTINNTNGTNLNTASWRTLGTGTITIAQSVTVEYTFIDDVTGNPIEGVNVILGTTLGATDVINNVLSNASGVVSVTYSGSTPQSVLGYAAKGTAEPVYQRRNLSGTIGAGGLVQTIRMLPD